MVILTDWQPICSYQGVHESACSSCVVAAAATIINAPPMTSYFNMLIETNELPNDQPAIMFCFDPYMDNFDIDFGVCLQEIAGKFGLHFMPSVNGRLQFQLEGRRYDSDDWDRIEEAGQVARGYHFLVLKRARLFIDGKEVHCIPPDVTNTIAKKVKTR